MGHLTKIANLVVFALEKGKNKDMAQEVFDGMQSKDTAYTVFTIANIIVIILIVTNIIIIIIIIVITITIIHNNNTI